MARPKTITEPMEHLPFLIETSLKEKFTDFCTRSGLSKVDYLRGLIQREALIWKLAKRAGVWPDDYIRVLLERESVRLDKKKLRG